MCTEGSDLVPRGLVGRKDGLKVKGGAAVLRRVCKSWIKWVRSWEQMSTDGSVAAFERNAPSTTPLR